MPRSAVAEGIHIAALGVWLGSVVVTGAAAAMTFPVMRDLAPVLPEYAEYAGPHWLIAGGKIVNRLFFVSDIAQGACALVATLTFIAVVPALSRPVRLIRIAVLLPLLAILGYRFGILGPRMSQDLAAYWDAARIGDHTAAAAFKGAFDAAHPVVSRLIGAMAALVALALVASVVPLARPTPMPEPLR